MRKLVSLSILLFLLLPNCFLLCCFCLYKKVAYANELTNYVFARAQTSGVVLYKTPSVISSNNVFFEIPQSYFVMLISNFSDEFYRAQYKDVVGYVLKTDITPVAEKPQNPFFEGSFRVFSSDGTDVLSSPFPSLGANVVASVEKFETVEYFGTISGEELIEGRGTTWLFGKTQNGEFGFFYQGLCDQISAIPTNVEEVTPINNPFGSGDNEYLYSLVNLSTPLKILLIVLVSAPAVLLVMLLFSPQKFVTGKPRVAKEKAKSKMVKQIEDFSDENY